jgi:hypothetical protein
MIFIIIMIGTNWKIILPKIIEEKLKMIIFCPIYKQKYLKIIQFFRLRKMSIFHYHVNDGKLKHNNNQYFLFFVCLN